MNKVVLDLQRDCTNLSIPCNQLLLKAYAIASKLNMKSVLFFFNNELTGYAELLRKDIPLYRVLENQGILYVDVNHCILPIQPPKSEDFAYTLLPHSIGEIESMDLSNGGYLYASLRPEEHLYICKQNKIDTTTIIQKKIPIYVLKQILLNVRFTILKWTLFLEKNGIWGDNLEFSAEEQKRGTEIQDSINIIIFGDVSGSNITGVSKESLIGTHNS